MTQQPYPPQYPQAPVQQPYAQPAYPPQQQQPPGYQQPYAPPQAPPAPPLAQGTLDDYYNQPTSGSGPSISWSANGQPKPIGTWYAGIVARDVTNGDVQQQTDPTTKQPKFYSDGRPQFVMKVPLKVQPSAEFPEGEATWFVRGQARDELTRAMSEAGCTGAPKAGAGVSVQLVQRRPSRGGGNPANIVQITYTPAGGTGAPSPAPVPQPVVQAQPEQPPTWAQPAPVQQQVPLAQPVQQPQVQYAQPVQQQAPQGAPLPAPAGLDPEQAALLARITQGQPQGAPQQ